MKLNFRPSTFFISLVYSLFTCGECEVKIRPLDSARLGQNVTIFCDVFNEALSDLIWRRYSYYNLSLVKNLLSSNLPDRYSLNNTYVNPAYSVSALSIGSVNADDFSTYECSSSSLHRVNLTQNFSIIVNDKNVDPLTLCLNGNYNSGLYVMLLISSFILSALLFGFYKLLSSNNPALDVVVTFGCFVGSIGFLIMMILFWVSPNYISSYPSNIYWSPVIIIPSFMFSFCFLWSGILFLTARAYLRDKQINLAQLLVIFFVAFSHSFLLFVILCSLIYCTGQSTFPALRVDYSIVSCISSGIIVTMTFSFLVFFFWIFKEQMSSVSVEDMQQRNRLKQSSTYSDIQNKEKITLNQQHQKQLTVNSETSRGKGEESKQTAVAEALHAKSSSSLLGVRCFLFDDKSKVSPNTTTETTAAAKTEQKPSNISQLISAFRGKTAENGEDGIEKKTAKKSDTQAETLIEELNTENKEPALFSNDKGAVTAKSVLVKKVKKIKKSLAAAAAEEQQQHSAENLTTDGEAEKKATATKKAKKIAKSKEFKVQQQQNAEAAPQIIEFE